MNLVGVIVLSVVAVFIGAVKVLIKLFNNINVTRRVRKSTRGGRI